jgi:cell division topological specificity factor
MGLGTFFGRLLGRPEAVSSRTAATDRLKLVLMHDRTDIPATMMEAIRTEMVALLSKYVEIDTEALDVQLEREQGAIGLVLNIPIKRVKTELEAAEALETMHALQRAQAGEPGAADQPASEAVAVDDGDEAAAESPAGEAPAPSEGDAARAETPDRALASDEGAFHGPAPGSEAGLGDGAPAPESAGPDAAEEQADEGPSRVEAEPASGRAAAVIEAPQPAKTVTLPVRRLSALKGPDIGALLQRSDDDGEERPKVVRDAWYSAEALLAPTPSERGEPSD